MKILIAGLLIALAFLFGNINTEYAETKAYYTVEAGDTLWSVAGQYYNKQDRHQHFGEFQWQIREANADKFANNRMLQPGDVLIIPLERKVANGYY